MAEKDHTDQIVTRLRRIEGQIRGIQRMVEEGRECEDLVTQLMAARSGLDQVGRLLLDSHVRRCVAGIFADDDPRVETLEKAIAAWTRFAPSPAETAGS